MSRETRNFAQGEMLAITVPAKCGLVDSNSNFDRSLKVISTA